MNKIDFLKLVRNADGTYRINGTYNSDGTEPALQIQCKYDEGNADLRIEVSDDEINYRIEFSYDQLDFSNYGRHSMVHIILQNSVSTSLNAELGGVCIRDTDYPPPYHSPLKFLSSPDPHKLFTDKFTIMELELERVPLNGDLFNVTIKLKENGAKNYVATAYNLLPDSLRSGVDSIVMYVRTGQAANGNVNFPLLTGQELPVRLSTYYSRGLSFVITDQDPIDWKSISTKKVLAYIS